jgi:hypothetical protein
MRMEQIPKLATWRACNAEDCLSNVEFPQARVASPRFNEVPHSAALWSVGGLEFFFTFCSLLLLRRGLGRLWLRWSVVLCFYGLWTYVAILLMQGVYR